MANKFKVLTNQFTKYCGYFKKGEEFWYIENTRPFIKVYDLSTLELGEMSKKEFRGLIEEGIIKLI